MLVAIIIACEIGFWVLLGAGLATRYVLRRDRTSAVLLASVPLVDLVLLAATVADLARGATAEFGHGLAAAYLGFSVAFGHGLIKSLDARFAHRFAGGPAPQKPPRYGAARTQHEWRLFGKAVRAWAIATGLLGLAILVVGDASRTAELEGWLVRLTIGLAVWAIWPVSLTLWPPRPRASEPA